MVSKTTSTNHRKAGFTVAEFLFAVAIGSFALIIVATSGRMIMASFVSLDNYMDLDQTSRSALNLMSREIRQADRLQSHSATNLTFVDFDNTPLSYTYDPERRELVRTKGNESRVLLTDCDTLNFAIYQRNPVQGTYDQYPTADVNTCKLVQLNWRCSRINFGGPDNTEVVQSAKFVIRKQ